MFTEEHMEMNVLNQHHNVTITFRSDTCCTYAPVGSDTASVTLRTTAMGARTRLDQASQNPDGPSASLLPWAHPFPDGKQENWTAHRQLRTVSGSIRTALPSPGKNSSWTDCNPGYSYPIRSSSPPDPLDGDAGDSCPGKPMGDRLGEPHGRSTAKTGTRIVPDWPGNLARCSSRLRRDWTTVACHCCHLMDPVWSRTILFFLRSVHTKTATHYYLR